MIRIREGRTLMITERDLRSHAGERLPGGRVLIEPYADWLLRDVVRAPADPGGLAHPAAAFLLATEGLGIGLEELFARFGASSRDGPMLGEWAVDTLEPLRPGRAYQAAAEVTGAVRKSGSRAGIFDLVSVTVTLAAEDGRPHAVVRPVYVFPRRTASPGAGPGTGPGGRAGGAAGRPAPKGDPLPPLTIEAVDPEKMKIMAALLRDPNPIHFDPAAARAAGLGDGTVNQGPVTIAYVQNMLASWAGGEDRIGALSLRLTANVLSGDRVAAGGRVVGAGSGSGAECAVWLDVTARAGEPLAPPLRALSGTAKVALA